MIIERSFDKYYNLTGDEKSKVGNCTPLDDSVNWDFFDDKSESFNLKEPITFKIDEGRFSGTTGDYQINNCGFFLFSDKLRGIFESHLTNEDRPIWYPAKVIDLNNRVSNYSILHFFDQKDLLDYNASTFVSGTDQPIKMRYDLTKIGARLIFKTVQSSSICVHDIIREKIKKVKCEGAYLYKIHTAGRLS